MSPIPGTGHLSPEDIQDFLEGVLRPPEEARLREHLAECSRCQEEVREWQVLFADLGGLGQMAPPRGFSEAVMARLRAASAPVPGKRWWSLGLGRRRHADVHLSPPTLQEYLEGRLGRRAQEQAEAHLAVCSLCREELAGWRRLWGNLGNLGHFSPSPEFAQGVLARLRSRSGEAPAPAPAPSPWTSIVRWAGRAQKLLPRSPRGWAVAGGVAMGPVLVAAALVWRIFSHPLVSVDTILTYLMWKTSSALAGALGAAGQGFAGNVLLTALYSVFQGATRAPWLLGVGSFLFSLSCAGSAWLLYRLLTSPRESRRHAQVPS